MESTCAQISSVQIELTRAKATVSHLAPIISMARRFGGIFAALNVILGRRTSVLPGASDRSVARLAAGEHHEDIIRWNALAHQYGGTRIKL